MLVNRRTIFLVPILFLLSKLSLASIVKYNVKNYGAKSGGTTDSTKAFLDAWTAACASAVPSMVYAPSGVFLLGKTTTFSGKDCKNKVTLQIDGTLIAPSNYKVIGNNENWLVFLGVNGVTVSGGTLDGQGGGLWKCKASGNHCPTGASTLAFYDSTNVVISNLTSISSQRMHVKLEKSQNVILQGLNISNPGNSPNTDGIHVEKSSMVAILASNIATGDDCVSIGPGSTNVSIENVYCGPGHGISIGSLARNAIESGVQNVTVKNVILQGTTNGVRIKTWARPSNGFVKDVLYQNVTMVDAENPIIIDQFYCPGNKGCPSQGSGVRISGVTFRQIHGTSSSEVAISMACSKARPCRGITLQDINLTYGDNHKPAQASCSSVSGTSVGIVKPKGCL